MYYAYPWSMGVLKRTPPGEGGGGGGGHSREVWVEVYHRDLQTLTLFKTKIVYFETIYFMILIRFVSHTNLSNFSN